MTHLTDITKETVKQCYFNLKLQYKFKRKKPRGHNQKSSYFEKMALVRIAIRYGLSSYQLDISQFSECLKLR